MSKRSNKRNKTQNQTVPTTKQISSNSEINVKEVTIETVKASRSQEEFDKLKSQLIYSMEEEINILKVSKTEITETIKRTQISLNLLNAQIKQLTIEKKELETSYKDIKSDYEKAQNIINTADKEAKSKLEKVNAYAKAKLEQAISDYNAKLKEADEEVQKKLDDSEKERLKIVAETAEETRKVWKEQANALTKKLASIAQREQKLISTKLELEEEKSQFALEKEALEEMRIFLTKREEKYRQASPARVEELEIELNNIQGRYDILMERYKEQTSKLNETLILLDTIKQEVTGTDGLKEVVSLKQIVEQLHELRVKYNRLQALFDKYKNPEDIEVLEQKAQKVDALERDRDKLEQERNRYREEAQAAKNVQRELEVVKQEVDATNILNEHLLQELEAHKTALESRTGDTCPSLTKVDSEVEENDFINKVNDMMSRPQINSLADIVKHVKNYAGSRAKEERLYYTENDIRAFLAGMSVSRLLILQGMSGTGKSSLPRIFAEAISGFNKLIPVESSWRDRNELLGYYNDFNKKFNAKSFTIELYRSAKKQCQNIPTFIVLDEMNLARIEYYFSDFLAILQEPDPKKWLIELVSSDMRTLPMELPDSVKQKMKKENLSVYNIWEKIEKSHNGDLKIETSDDEKKELTAYLEKLGKLTSAKDLIDGRKIRVTNNIWFVGTANRDESTFEISDKVYDRAQIVSLNRKGIAEGKYTATHKKFISVDMLEKLFKAAKDESKSRDAVEEKLDALDKILIEYFDVSFGNRIVTQTIDFVTVFMAAGGKLEDALDYQISTKILRKVISSDDSDALNELLLATRDYSETQRLINKRIKELR